MKKNCKQKKQLGVSLLETLIYIGIFAIISGAITGIFWNVTKVATNQEAANEVDENLRQAIAIIGDKVRNSAIIQSATGSTLILKMTDFSTTTFSVVDNRFYLKEGSADSLEILSNKVQVDSLEFTKIEMAGAKGGVRVNMALSYINNNNPNLAFTKSLLSTINRAVAITFNEDILPGINNTYYVGNNDLRWKNGYFSGDVDGSHLCIDGDCKGSWADVGQWISTSTGIYYMGKVAIGRDDPGQGLAVSTTGATIVVRAATLEDADGSSSVVVSNTDAVGSLGAYNDAYSTVSAYSGKVILQSNDGSLGLSAYKSGYDIEFYAGNRTTPKMIINGDDGNVTIGNSTSTANAKLNIVGSGGSTSGSNFINSNDEVFASYFVDDNADSDFRMTYLGSGGSDITVQADGDVILASGTGKVGIGETTPSEKLDIDGNIAITGTVKPDNACGNVGTVITLTDNVVNYDNLAFGYAFGPPMVCSGVIKAISANCNIVDSSNHSAFEVRVNGASQVCDTDEIINLNTTYMTTGCNVAFSAGDALNCYSKTITGTPQYCNCVLFVQFD